MVFLNRVESPHIDKLYKTNKPEDDADQQKLLYGPDGLFPMRGELILLVNFNFRRTADVMTAIIAIYTFISALLLPVGFAVGQAVFTTTLHYLAMGYVLTRQSKSRWWTDYWHDRLKGISHPMGLDGGVREGFRQWKRLYNMSRVLKSCSILALALRMMYELGMPGTVAEFITMVSNPQWLAMNFLGVAFIAVSMTVNYAVLTELGEFAWFYSDFFVPKEWYRPQVHYTGVYRFLNNPTVSFGVLEHYGYALLAKDMWLLYLAVAVHLCEFFFQRIVEIPHMNRLYHKNRIRQQTPMMKEAQRSIIEYKRGLLRLTSRLGVWPVATNSPYQSPALPRGWTFAVEKNGTITLSQPPTPFKAAVEAAEAFFEAAEAVEATEIHLADPKADMDEKEEPSVKEEPEVATEPEALKDPKAAKVLEAADEPKPKAAEALEAATEPKTVKEPNAAEEPTAAADPKGTAAHEPKSATEPEAASTAEPKAEGGSEAAQVA